MTTLQTAATYSVLIYTSLMIIAMIAGLIVGLVVKSKIKKAKDNVKEKLNIISNLPYIAKEVAKAFKSNK